MKEFRDYDVQYPNLIVDILEYFNASQGDKPEKKNIKEFCDKYSKKGNKVQYDTIVKICDILYHNNILILIKTTGPMDMCSVYLFYITDMNRWNTYKDYYIHYYNSLVYGFEYIYRAYKDIVLPIIAYKDGVPHMGSCFKCNKGIMTARHCLTDGETISIRGYTAEQLNRAVVYVSKNPNVDIAYIYTNEVTKIFTDKPHVLDEVLVMGYPMIPRFLDFCTAEKATISTIADLRMTPSRGSITAIADEIFTKDITELMLITAKIKGGNSGGPVINKTGCVVGVSFSDPKGEGYSYDDLGYGIACPISVLDSIVEDGETLDVKFVDFEE